MQEILKKIYPYSKKQAVNDILKSYEKNSFVVSNFIYFSIIKTQKLFESGKKSTRQKEYKKAIMKGHFLLPDGIALQIFYNIAAKQLKSKLILPTKKLQNLNGTDFVPYFLDELKKIYGSQKICLMLYGAKADILKDAKRAFEYKGFNVIFTQDGYSSLDRKKLLDSQVDYQDTINVLLVARSTVDNPIQELWTLKNWTKLRQAKLIVFTVGGLFDFMAGDLNTRHIQNKSVLKNGAQKRAPQLIRNLKLEWLRRLITDPKRNYKKVKNSFALFPYILKYLLLKKE